VSQFLVNNIIYPEYETLKGIGGTVYISFVIDIDGSVTRVKLLRGVSKGIDAEAIRVVKLFPKWIPGTLNGRPVRVRFNMPLYFKIKR
jgi:protein TonB